VASRPATPRAVMPAKAKATSQNASVKVSPQDVSAKAFSHGPKAKVASRLPPWAAIKTDAEPGVLIYATFNPGDGLMTYSEDGMFARQSQLGGFNSVIFSRESAKTGVLSWMLHMGDSSGRYGVGVCSASSQPDALSLFGRSGLTCQIMTDKNPMRGKFVLVTFDCQNCQACFSIGDKEDCLEQVSEQTHVFDGDVRLFVAGYMVAARLIDRCPKLVVTLKVSLASEGDLAITCYSVGGEELAAIEAPSSQTLGVVRSALLAHLKVPARRLDIITSEGRLLGEPDDGLSLLELHLPG